MGGTMQEILDTLLELQEVDIQIFEIEKSKRDYPEKIKQLSSEIETQESIIAEKKSQIANLDTEQRDFEMDIQKANDFLKKSQDRLSAVKNNREYDSLQEEIDVQREKISESETEIIRIMDSLEELKSVLDEHESSFGDLKGKNDSEISELTQVLASIKEKRAAQESERAIIAERTEPNLLTTYERIRKGYKNGVAVAGIKRGACGGCFQRIPPQQIAEIKKQDKIMRCEICGRLLVWNGEDE